MSANADVKVLKSLTSINHITQDNSGFIWFAGQQGLSRFDGQEVITYGKFSDKWPLPFTWLHHIANLNDKFLLSTETSGVWLFNPKDGYIDQLPISIDNQSTISAHWFKNNYYFIADKLYKLDPVEQTTQIIDSHISYGDFVETTENLYYFDNQKLSIVTALGLDTVFEGDLKTVIVIEDKVIVALQNKLIVIENNQITTSLNVDFQIQLMTKSFNEKSIFVLDLNGKIHQFDTQLIKLKHQFKNINDKRVRFIYHDSSDVIWYASSQGVGRVSKISITDKDFIFNASINVIELEKYRDELIIGSYGDGLHTYNDSSKVINKDIADKLIGDSRRINDLKVVENQLYLATFDGLWRYDLINHSIDKLKFDDNNQIMLGITHHGNKLYISTDGNGFIVFDIETQQQLYKVDAIYPFSSPEIIDIEIVNDKELWLATAAGIDIYDAASDKIRHINIPSTSKIISLIATNNKIFAFSKREGAFILNYDGELLKQIGKGIDFGKAALVQDHIWAPSRNGVYQIDIKTFALSLIPNTQEFSFTCEPVLIDDNIYIGHFGGVVKIPISQPTAFDANIIVSKVTVSGQSTVLNKVINIDSANDVVQLDLASLDYRPGIAKQFKYQINKGLWYPVSGNQLNLTGLASGSYYINIKGTNSLGQWSNHQTFAEIHVAYPWYWTPRIRVLYAVFLIGFISLVLWLLYLRGRSISHIHALLANDIKTKGKAVLNVQKNLSNLLTLWHQCIDDNDKLLANKDKVSSLIEKSIEELHGSSYAKTPDGLYGKTLSVALPYLIDYAEKKYHVKIHYTNDIDESTLSYELQSDIYTMLYHAITSAVLNGNGRVFNISIKEFKQKIWLTISDDEGSFTNYKSKINFDMAMYFIRQIANKYKASVNVFEERPTGSQLVISVPLMTLS
ncbi:hypothetical protein [Thalassotalea ganghwensis]